LRVVRGGALLMVGVVVDIADGWFASLVHVGVGVKEGMSKEACEQEKRKNTRANMKTLKSRAVSHCLVDGRCPSYSWKGPPCKDVDAGGGEKEGRGG
jgi:hypothetical protein